MTDILIHACFGMWLNKATLEWMKAIDAIVNQKAAREKAKEKP